MYLNLVFKKHCLKYGVKSCQKPTEMLLIYNMITDTTMETNPWYVIPWFLSDYSSFKIIDVKYSLMIPYRWI